MEWVKIDTRIFMHTKMEGVPDKAQLVHIRAICRAGLMETDGHISPATLRELRGTAKVAEALVDAGLWEQNGNGWVIHDWLEHQQSAARLRERKAMNRDRVQRHREAKRETDQ